MINFKDIRPAHLLDTFGKQENEEVIAVALRITGGNTAIHFTRQQLARRTSRPIISYYIHDFTFNGWITEYEEFQTYTINQKLIDYINGKEKQITKRMAKGNSYGEVLGITKDLFRPIDQKKFVAFLTEKGVYKKNNDTI